VSDPHDVLDEVLAPGLTRRWRLDRVIHAEQTPYQRVLIAETSHGTTLFCDGERQSAESSQLVYHEALFLPAALLADRCERVLVIGSSEGVVSQLAVAAGAQLVDHVDIDAECVRACAGHLPYGYTPAELAAAERHEGPVRLHYADGHTFVEEAAGRPGGGRYDVVVVDLPDERPDEPDAQINRLYRSAFLRRCAGLLTDGGVVVSQAGSPALWRNATLRAAWDRFREVFAQVVPFVSDEHEWVFLTGAGTARPDPVAEALVRLDRLATPPTSIDAPTLRSRTVAPYHLRHG
jgi:spermidine synthase